jgi:hypothetical protein
LENAFRAIERESDRLAASPAVVKQIGFATARLRALRSCLEAVDDDRIYGALVAEINVALLQLRRTLATSARWVPLWKHLHGLPFGEAADHSQRRKREDTRGPREPLVSAHSHEWPAG